MVHYCDYGRAHCLSLVPCAVLRLILHEQTEDTMPAQRMSLPHHISSPVTDLDDPYLYINRELSWLQFNWRVLEEALAR